MSTSRLSFFRWLLAGFYCAVLAGCGTPYTPPATNLLPDLYPAAMLVEPIKMRAGYVHTSTPIKVDQADQIWEISLGFARQDAVIPGVRFFCLLDPRKGRERRNCPDDEPGIYVKWELLRNDGTTVGEGSYDALVQRNPGSQSSLASLIVSLGELRSPGADTFRIRLYVLRDFPELDVTNPQLVVNMAFFRRR